MLNFVCPKCGSTNIVCDAVASWNVTKQDWELAGLHDTATCNDCDYESYVDRFEKSETEEWSGSPDPDDPDNYWIDDVTGERVNAHTGERSKG